MLRQGNINEDLWKDVKAKDLGAGFSKVNIEDYFDIDKKKRLAISLDFSKVADASNFIKNCKPSNRFITFFLTPIAVDKNVSRSAPSSKKSPTKRDSDVTITITDKQKRNFSKLTKQNIETVKAFYLDNILPYSVGVNTAFLETNELVAQLLDDKIDLPSTFFKTKLQEAVQIKTVFFIKKYLNLNDAEAHMFIDTVHKATPNNTQSKDNTWQLTNLETMLKAYLKKTT
jgi:hypothetical protein